MVLYSVSLIFESLNFQIRRLRKELGQRVGSLYSCKLRLLHKLRDTNLSYLSKDKKLKKVYITACINPIQHGLFWGCSRMGWGAKSPPP